MSKNRLLPSQSEQSDVPMLNLKSLMLWRPYGSLRSTMAFQKNFANCGESGLGFVTRSQKKESICVAYLSLAVDGCNGLNSVEHLGLQYNKGSRDAIWQNDCQQYSNKAA